MVALVSVITPCFNHEKYLDDYFHGLLSQTYPNIELILFDDGSTDRSWQVIESHRDQLQRRISHLVLERCENIGPLRQRARALRIATGDYVCMLDSDDFYYPNKIAENVAVLADNSHVGAVYSDYDKLTENGIARRFNRRFGRAMPSGSVSEHLCRASFINPLTVCFRKELLDRYVDYDRYTELGYGMGDYPTLLAVSQHTDFRYIDESLACSRSVQGSLSRPREVTEWVAFGRNSFRIVFDHMAAYEPTPQTRSYAEGLRATFLMMSAARLLRAGRARESLSCWRDADVRQAVEFLAAHGPAVWKAYRHVL